MMSQEIRDGLERLRQNVIEMGKRLADLQSTTPTDQWDACLANFASETGVSHWLDRQSAQELIEIAVDPDVGALPDIDDQEAVLADRVIRFHLARIAALFEKREVDWGPCL